MGVARDRHHADGARLGVDVEDLHDVGSLSGHGPPTGHQGDRRWQAGPRVRADGEDVERLVGDFGLADRPLAERRILKLLELEVPVDVATCRDPNDEDDERHRGDERDPADAMATALARSAAYALRVDRSAEVLEPVVVRRCRVAAVDLAAEGLEGFAVRSLARGGGSLRTPSTIHLLQATNALLRTRTLRHIRSR